MLDFFLDVMFMTPEGKDLTVIQHEPNNSRKRAETNVLYSHSANKNVTFTSNLVSELINSVYLL